MTKKEKATPTVSAKKKSGAAHPSTFPIVGVGASAGGLEAFTEFLKHLPMDTGMGFVLVQHLDPDHESALTQILSRATKLPVREVTNEERVLPNTVHIIPPNTFLRIERGVLKLEPRGAGRTPPHSVDFFFESLAQDAQERAIGVVLSGVASDGPKRIGFVRCAGNGFTGMVLPPNRGCMSDLSCLSCVDEVGSSQVLG